MVINKELKALLSGNLLHLKKISIITHTNPDGDAIGSVLALYNILKQAGFKVTPITPNNFPGFLKWLSFSKDIIIFDCHRKKAEKAINESDIIFCLDFNSINRIESMKDALTSSKAIKVLIDHHQQPEKFTDHIISKTDISSTSELVYRLCEELHLNKYFNKNFAEALYVGIITDTGSFSYSCNYPETFTIVSELIRLGIDTERIHQLVYDNNSEHRLRLLGYCLSEKLVVLKDFHTAYIYLNKNDLVKFNYKIGDTEGVVNYALSIEDINFAAIFIEKDNFVRISFRSKGKFSVNSFAREHFYGGGHLNASGGNSYVSLDKSIQDFIELLPKYKNDIKNAV